MCVCVCMYVSGGLGKNSGIFGFLINSGIY